MTASVTSSFAQAWNAIDEADQVRQTLQYLPASDTPADQEQHEADILKRVAAHLKRWDCAAALARNLDCKPTVIKLLLESPQTIPAPQRATLLTRADAWISAEARRWALGQAAVVPTAIVRAIVVAARLAESTRTVVLIGGPPGVGKSASLPAIQAEIAGTVVFTADCDSRGARGALRALAVASAGNMPIAPRIGVKVGVGLLRQAHLVVCDEAQQLSVSGLEALRATAVDGAGCGLLLLGTAAMTRVFDDRADALLGPLASRIAAKINLSESVLGRDRAGWLAGDELAAILARQGLGKIEPAAARRLLHVANFAPGLVRRACSAARVAGVLASRRDKRVDAVVTEADVDAALRLAAAGGF